MAPSSAKAQVIKWRKVEQRKMKKKKKQESAVTRPSGYASTSPNTHELAGNNTKKEEENNKEEDICPSGCCTPKAKRFKIPEILSCPPAPKKRRVMQNYSSNRSPIAFFASPDIELFFSSLRNLSA